MRYVVRCLKRLLFGLTILPLGIALLVLGLASVPFCFFFTGEGWLWCEVLTEDIPDAYYEWATGKEAMRYSAPW